MNLATVASVACIINLPFGYWRANEKKLSPRWFLAIHLPVPFIIALRLFSGLGWQLLSFPVMIGAYFGGQFAGGKLHNLRKNKKGIPVSSCLVRDLMAGDPDCDKC